MNQQAEEKKKKDRKSNGTRQKNKRGDSKVESNDNPEIPDRGETSDIPGMRGEKKSMHVTNLFLNRPMPVIA